MGLGLGLGLRVGASAAPRASLLSRLAAAGDMMFAVDASLNATRTDVSGAVSAITAGAAGFNPFAQSTAGLRPVASARSTQFDGVDKYLTQGNDRGTGSLAARATLPDGASSVGGVMTGFISGMVYTVTGVVSGAIPAGTPELSGVNVTPGTIITSFGTGTGGLGTYNVSISQTTPSTTITARHGACGDDLGMLSNGKFVSNCHGRDGGGDLTPIPSVMCYGLGDSVPTWETLYTDCGVANTASGQGLAVLPDDTIWACATGTGKMIHLNSDGTLIQVLSGFSSVANGLTYDPAYPGHLVVGLSNSAVVSWIRLSDLAVIKTVTLTATPDQLTFDAVRGWLWFTYGTDGVSGNVSAFSLHNNALVGNYVLPEADCIEGIVWVGNTLYVNNDAYFHSGTVKLNQTLTFTMTPLPTGAAPGSRFGFGWAGQIPSTKASTGAVIAGGQASLTSAGTMGIELVVPTGSSVLQNIITQNQTFGFASSLLAWHYYFWDVNLTAKTIEYFFDGVSQGTTSITAVTAAYLTAQNWALGAEHRAAGPVTFGKNYVGRAIALINPDTWRAEAMAWLAAA